MNMLFGTKLDLTNVNPTSEYTPLPEGVYTVICTEFDVQPETEKGQGAKVKFQVIEGEYTNRRIGDYFILTHVKSIAQDIGQRRLRAMCNALGIPPVLESAEPLLHKPMKAKVTVEDGRVDERTGKTYGPQNRIETFYSVDNAPAAAPAAVKVATRAAVAASPAPRAAVAAAPATAPSASKPMPWKR